MKTPALLLLLCLFNFTTYGGKVEFTYYFDAPETKEAGEFLVFSFNNTCLTGITGEPVLPYQGVNLLLPPGEEAVSATYEFEDETDIPGTFRIYPGQPSRPVSSGGDGNFYLDPEIYGSPGRYPSRPWGENSTHFLNGHSVFLSSFTPLNYIPVTGKVSYYRKVTVTVVTGSTERSSRALQLLNTSEGISGRVRSLVQNPGSLRDYPVQESRDEGYHILIIAPQAFGPSFDQIRDLYLVRGLKSESVTTEFIASNVEGQDLPEQIRNYIIQEYQQNSIGYVILGGDVQQVPYRGFYCYVQSGSGYEDSNIPADVYYSALDGNWNNDGDGYWGEPGEDDLLPDVAVARYPAGTMEQLQKLISKTCRYQDEPVAGELRNPLLAGEKLLNTPLTYGEDYLELLIGYHEDNGYTTNGIPEDQDFDKLYDHLAGWSGSDLMQAVNDGRSFIHHSGHADQFSVMRLGISQVNNANFAGANGILHNYTLVYTHGCLCGAFDENDCIGEAMVLIDNFAVAGAFNSRYGWFNEGQTEGPSAHLHREFVDALYQDRECHIGTAHMISKIESSTWVNAPGQWEEGALRWCFYSCNILGDPVLGVWTDEPVEIETAYPQEILPSTTTVPVNVTSNGQPVTGLNVVIMGDGNLLGVAVTDDSGQATVSIPGGFEGVSNPELVVSGYNCLPHHYPLAFQVGLTEVPAGNLEIRNRPNPFLSETMLIIHAEQACRAELTFFQISGQELGRMNIQLHAGENRIYQETENWPDGMILARLVAEKSVTHHRMIRLGK